MGVIYAVSLVYCVCIFYSSQVRCNFELTYGRMSGKEREDRIRICVWSNRPFLFCIWFKLPLITINIEGCLISGKIWNNKNIIMATVWLNRAASCIRLYRKVPRIVFQPVICHFKICSFFHKRYLKYIEFDDWFYFSSYSEFADTGNVSRGRGCF